MADERRDRAETPVSRPRSGSPSVRNQGVWDAVGELVRQREADLGRPLRVLDLGGGSGGLAVPLAELGHAVTVFEARSQAGGLNTYGAKPPGGRLRWQLRL